VSGTLCVDSPSLSTKVVGNHLEHHKYIGEDGIDVDLPHDSNSLSEQCLRKSVFSGGVICLVTFPPKNLPFSTFQILFYALRPGLVRSQKPTYWHFIVLQLNYPSIFYLRSLYPVGSAYWPISLCPASGWQLTPLAGHFIAEHYVWTICNKRRTHTTVG